MRKNRLVVDVRTRLILPERLLSASPHDEQSSIGATTPKFHLRPQFACGTCSLQAAKCAESPTVEADGGDDMGMRVVPMPLRRAWALAYPPERGLTA